MSLGETDRLPRLANGRPTWIITGDVVDGIKNGEHLFIAAGTPNGGGTKETAVHISLILKL